MRGLLLSALACIAAAAPPTQSALYGLSYQTQLIQLYPNGSSTTIGPALPKDAMAQSLSTIDRVRGLFIFIGYDETTGLTQATALDLNTGAVVYKITVPIVQAAFVGVGQQIAVFERTGDLIIGSMNATETHFVAILNVTSGDYKIVATAPSSLIPVLGGAFAYDPADHTFLIEFGYQNTIVLGSIDLNTGNYTIWDFKANDSIETLNWDELTGEFYGLSLVVLPGNKWVRSLAFMNGTDFTVTQIGNCTDYGIMSGGEAALDTEKQILYWIGEPTNASTFSLIGLSLLDASVASAGPLCTQDALCPWELQFYNPAA